MAKGVPFYIAFKDSGFKNNKAKESVKQLLKEGSLETEMKEV